MFILFFKNFLNLKKKKKVYFVISNQLYTGQSQPIKGPYVARGRTMPRSVLDDVIFQASNHPEVVNSLRFMFLKQRERQDVNSDQKKCPTDQNSVLRYPAEAPRKTNPRIPPLYPGTVRDRLECFEE